MKFINYLSSITDIAIFPMISFLLFFIFFLVLTLYAIRVDKQHIIELKNIPLSDENN